MRYTVSNTIEIAEILDFDVAIIGMGLAGLYTAMHLDANRTCCILTKEQLDSSNSWLAQGGIAAAVAVDDTKALHLEDTLIAGAGLCNEAAARILADEAPTDIQILQDYGVPFDRDGSGGLRTAREGGHRRRRVLHVGGDATGRETVRALSERVAQRAGTVRMGRAFLVEVLLDEDKAVWGALIHAQGAYRIIRTRALVMATGGIGQVYQTTTNPEVATGDGIAAAARAGAALAGMEFIQFHPTGLWQKGRTGRAFLISETLRGEGAILRNQEGTAFMAHTHELKDLAPRDIVARAIVNEMEREGSEHVYLDIRHKEKDYLAKRFPTIFEQCQKVGIDISRDQIPVAPVQHYLIGGIEADLYGRTSVQGLYACGEAAATGVHGANRLAANSMLECLVFGRRTAQEVGRALAADMGERKADYTPKFPAKKPFTIEAAHLRARVQAIMQHYGGTVRTQAGLKQALEEIETIKSKLASGTDDRRAYIELCNLTTIAEAILQSALRRTESIGAHYRRDETCNTSG